MSVSIGSKDYGEDERQLLVTFRKLDDNQRDEVIRSLPKPDAADEEKFKTQVAFIKQIASGKPKMRLLSTDKDVLTWEEEMGEDFGTTAIFDNISIQIKTMNSGNEGSVESQGIITVTPKDIPYVPHLVPYATFEYDSQEYKESRSVQYLMLKNNGKVVVQFERNYGTLYVSFPQSFDTDKFIVDKNISVYIVDDI